MGKRITFGVVLIAVLVGVLLQMHNRKEVSRAQLRF